MQLHISNNFFCPLWYLLSVNRTIESKIIPKKHFSLYCLHDVHPTFVFTIKWNRNIMKYTNKQSLTFSDGNFETKSKLIRSVKHPFLKRGWGLGIFTLKRNWTNFLFWGGLASKGGRAESLLSSFPWSKRINQYS